VLEAAPPPPHAARDAAIAALKTKAKIFFFMTFLLVK
jgi:hypothetical protein